MNKPVKPNTIPAAKPLKLQDLVAYQKDTIVSRTLTKQNGGTLTLFAFDAGQALSEHTAPFDAFVTILDGRAELVIEGKRIVAVKGETVLMPANIPHAVNAKVRFKMLLVMVRAVVV